MGLFGRDEVAVETVRQRRLGLEPGRDRNLGVDGLEKNPNFDENLGLLVPWLSSCCCFSGKTGLSCFLGIEVQKALLQPVTIFECSVSKVGFLVYEQGFNLVVKEKKWIEHMEMEILIIIITTTINLCFASL